MDPHYTYEQLRTVTMKAVTNQINGDELPVTTMKLAELVLNDLDDLQKTINVSQFTVLLFAVSRLFFYGISEGVDEANRIEAVDKAFDSGAVSVTLDPHLLDKYMK